MASMCSIASDPIESQRIDSHNFIRITRNIQFVGYSNYVPTLSPAIESNTTAILAQIELASSHIVNMSNSICIFSNLQQSKMVSQQFVMHFLYEQIKLSIQFAQQHFHLLGKHLILLYQARPRI